MAVVSGATAHLKEKAVRPCTFSFRIVPSHPMRMRYGSIVFLWQEVVRMRAVKRKCTGLLHGARPSKVWTHLPLSCCLLSLSKKLNFGCVLTMHADGLLERTRIGKQALTVVRRID